MRTSQIIFLTVTAITAWAFPDLPVLQMANQVYQNLPYAYYPTGSS